VNEDDLDKIDQIDKKRDWHEEEDDRLKDLYDLFKIDMDTCF